MDWEEVEVKVTEDKDAQVSRVTPCDCLQGLRCAKEIPDAELTGTCVSVFPIVIL